MSVDIVVQIRSHETRFISRVEDCAAKGAVAGVNARLESHLKALDECVSSAAVLNESLQVVMSVEGILPWEGLVVQVSPVAAAARNGILADEAAGVSWSKETRESKRSHVGVPVVAPVV